MEREMSMDPIVIDDMIKKSADCNHTVSMYDIWHHNSSRIYRCSKCGCAVKPGLFQKILHVLWICAIPAICRGYFYFIRERSAWDILALTLLCLFYVTIYCLILRYGKWVERLDRL